MMAIVPLKRLEMSTLQIKVNDYLRKAKPNTRLLKLQNKPDVTLSTMMQACSNRASNTSCRAP